MTRPLILLALSCAAASSHALTCDELKSEIDQKIRNAGVASFSLTIADAVATAPGKVVGSCENGNRKILYQAASTPTPTTTTTTTTTPTQAKASAAATTVLTECKPGFTGSDCSKRIAGQ